MEEIWKAIPGSEGRYEVSSLGGVRSLLRGGRTLRPARGGRGYLMVNPVINGANRPMRVHVLVLTAFVGPRPLGMVACHANDVPDDNRLENLRWDTPEANVRDRINSGQYHRNQKLSADQVREIRLDPRSHRQIATHYGLNRVTVKKIRAGRAWKHIPLAARRAPPPEAVQPPPIQET